MHITRAHVYIYMYLLLYIYVSIHSFVHFISFHSIHSFMYLYTHTRTNRDLGIGISKFSQKPLLVSNDSTLQKHPNPLILEASKLGMQVGRTRGPLI